MTTTYRTWTSEEEQFLQDHWGSKSVINIAKALNRPYGGVRRKATELKLSEPTLHYDGITVRVLMHELKVPYSTANTWIEKYGFPRRKKIFVKKNKVAVVKFDEFWEWAENHKHLINFAKLEPKALGKEPEWVEEKRQIDRLRFHERRPWTDEDIERLKSLVFQFRYTYPQMSAELQRPESSIKGKLIELGIQARPVSLNRHIKYTLEEIDMILDMLYKGYSFNAIANELNRGKSPYEQRSACGIRGKLERMGYRFESDKLMRFKTTS